MTWAEQCFALLPTHHPAATLLTPIQTYPNWDISHSDQMCDNQSGDDRLAKTKIEPKTRLKNKNGPLAWPACFQLRSRVLSTLVTELEARVWHCSWGNHTKFEVLSPIPSLVQVLLHNSTLMSTVIQL